MSQYYFLFKSCANSKKKKRRKRRRGRVHNSQRSMDINTLKIFPWDTRKVAIIYIKKWVNQKNVTFIKIKVCF